MSTKLNMESLTSEIKLSKIDESLKNNLFKPSSLVEDESIEILVSSVLNEGSISEDEDEDDLSSFDIEKDIMDDSDEFMIDALEDQGE